MNRIPIIYYHSIAPARDKQWYKSYLTFELVFFEDFLKYLASVNFRFLFLDEYFTIRNETTLKSEKLICLTFDDGYLDNYVFVYPLLKKYGAKGTIFISPEYVQKEEVARANLDDVWSGKINNSQLQTLGFVNWAELTLMQKSGFIDIQSHTMTHTKLPNNDKIKEFHHHASDYLYPISNAFPLEKPYYITNPKFKNLLPYGTPFFYDSSAIITRKVTINPIFEQECVSILSKTNWTKYNYFQCMESIGGLYEHYKKKNELILAIESQSEYENRIKWEIWESKKILEEKLLKDVKHICWPHGDYSEFCNQIAHEAGYYSSHIVMYNHEINCFPDRFDRMGLSSVANNRYLTLLKARYKIGSYRGDIPYTWLKWGYLKMGFYAKKN